MKCSAIVVVVVVLLEVVEMELWDMDAEAEMARE